MFLTVLFLALATATMTAPAARAAPLYAPQNRVQTARGVDLETLLAYLDRQQGRVIALQRELVSRPALNPEHGGSGEETKLRWLETWLHELGLTNLERLDYRDERVPGKVRGNLMCRLPARPGDTGNVRTLWLVSHLDVFAPGSDAEWKGDPFSLRVEGDLIYGRGTEDNHQAIVASLLLAQALRENGITPPMDIGLLFCPGALVGYAMNIEHVMRHRPDIFKPDDLILVMDHGNDQGGFSEVAEKTNLWFRITVTGMEGHAGSPSSTVNAFAAGASFINDLAALHAAFPARNFLFTSPESTFSPTLVENYSKAVNHIPGRFVFYLDARILPEYASEAVESALRELAETASAREGVRIDLELIEQTPNAPQTPLDAPVVQILDRAIQAQSGVKPRCGGIGGVTMASAIRARGLPVAVWGIQKNWHNKAEEFASIKDQLNQAKVLARMLYDPEAALPLQENPSTQGGKSRE